MANQGGNLIYPQWQNINQSGNAFIGKSNKDAPYLFSLSSQFTDCAKDLLMIGPKYPRYKEKIAELEKALTVVKKQIQSITVQCNMFYQSIGITESDTYSFDSKNGVMINYAGAKAFSNFFLEQWSDSNQSFEIKGNGIMRKELFSLLSSPAYISDMSEAVEQALNREGWIEQRKGRKVLKQGQHSQIGSQLATGIIKQLCGQTITKLTLNEIQNLLASSFISQKDNKRYILTQATLQAYDALSPLQKTYIYGENFQKISDLGSQYYSTLDSKLRTSFASVSEEFMSSLADSIYVQNKEINRTIIPEIMWTIFIEHINSKTKYPNLKGWLSGLQKNDIDRYKKIFIDYFKEVFLSYRNKPIWSLNEAAGALHEHSFRFDFNDKIFRSCLNGLFDIFSIGQEGYTGTDIILKIKNGPNKGKEVRLQFKNTTKDNLNDIKADRRIYAQSPVNMVSSKKTANGTEYTFGVSDYFSSFTQEQKNTFIFLLTNVYYLYNNGLAFSSVDGKIYREQLTQNNLDHIYGYLSFLINQTVAYLVGGKLVDEQSNIIYGNNQEIANMTIESSWSNKLNLFYVYNSKYLIPVSVFLLEVYNELFFLLQKEKNFEKTSFVTAHMEEASNINYFFGQNPNTGGNVLNPIYFFWAKYGYLQKGKKDNILKVGQEGATKILNSGALTYNKQGNLVESKLQIPEITFDFNFEELNKILGL